MSLTALLKSIVSKQTITLLQTQSISTALQTMSKFSISSIIIINDEKHPIGIFTEHDALRIISNKLNDQDIIQHVMTKNPFCVDEEMLIHDAYMLMEERKFRHLIVTDKSGCFVGVVTEGDFLRHLGFENLSNTRLVLDVMSDAPLIIEQNATLTEAVSLMQEHNCEYAIVLKGSSPIGIITERDIVQHYANVTDPQNESIEKILYRDLTMINQSTSLQEAAELMEHHNIHQLIVLNNNKKLIGVLSRHDVLRAIHGAYFEFLINLVDQKSSTIDLMNEQTQKIQNNQELIEKQSTFLNTIINTIPDLLWLKDTQGKYLLCNQMFECFFGAKESDIIGKTDFDFVDEDLAKFFRKNDLVAIEAGGIHSNEEYLIFADGSYEGHFDTTKMPMYDKEGNTIGVLGVAHDISELKRKDDEIAQVQALSHIGTWEWDIELNTFTGSKESHRIFEIPYGESASISHVLEHIYIEDREPYMMEMERRLKEKTICEQIYRIVGNNGAIRWIKSNGEFKYDSKGNAIKAIGILQDITETMEHERKLETLANYDSLTGLANRSLLLSHLQKTIDSSKRHKKSIALVMFDLDRFKDVNDSFGHSAGDELLRLVAERFTLRLREDDFVARLGGDEFAIVMNNFSHPEDAGILANDIIKTLVQEYKLSTGALVHIGSSAGIALFPNHGDNAEILLQHADAALYKAKAEGRGIYSYYTDELTFSARHRVDYETRLRRAIINEEFEVYYQPQVHISTGRIIGAEALIRWNDPIEGIISPAAFIPIAEDTGLINEIGEWVLNETCRQGKIWLDKGYRLTLAVNLSSNQICHQNIPQMVMNALNKNGYKAAHLELEITESALMQREEETVVMLHQLRGMGIRLAIDDFGTGYSSLSYLKRFPIDVLKIDKSFVDDIPFEKDDMAIVSAIIAMGQALGFQVLAEGTERIEQIEFLKEKGCTMYQGYYKSKPVPAAEFEKLLVENQH
jgi:diguanylate cyclase (GGDEF)-like protein/PAS domain S-box-containing protein